MTESLARCFVAVCTFTTLSGCVKLSGGIKSLIGKNDFLKTEFIVGGPQPADGVSQMLVGLQLKNSDNKPVASYLPTYSVVSGTGVITSACTTSDANGISACILKSVQAGQKTLELTNAKVGLKQNVVFENPSGKKAMNLISGASFHNTTNHGAQVSVSIGNATQGIKRTTTSGYVVNFSMHGSVGTP